MILTISFPICTRSPTLNPIVLSNLIVVTPYKSPDETVLGTPIPLAIVIYDEKPVSNGDKVPAIFSDANEAS